MDAACAIRRAHRSSQTPLDVSVNSPSSSSKNDPSPTTSADSVFYFPFGGHSQNALFCHYHLMYTHATDTYSSSTFITVIKHFKIYQKCLPKRLISTCCYDSELLSHHLVTCLKASNHESCKILFLYTKFI